jgi:hypothetical protein
VKLPVGEIVLFRFYDPRVWRIYLPTCSFPELEKWFDGIDEYRCEDADGIETLSYSLKSGGLDSTRLGVASSGLVVSGPTI